MGPIFDIAVSVSKNLVASVGADKYLRIFEFCSSSNRTITSNISSDTYETNYKQLSCFFSKEVMHSVSIHPMGFQIAVGTREGVKIFYVVENSTKLAVEINGK